MPASVLLVCAQYFLISSAENVLTTERMDPIVSPGKVSGHVHSGTYRTPVSQIRLINSSLVLGGSNFRLSTNTSFLRQSECSSIPIPQDKSNYWYPVCYLGPILFLSDRLMHSYHSIFISSEHTYASLRTNFAEIDQQVEQRELHEP